MNNQTKVNLKAHSKTHSKVWDEFKDAVEGLRQFPIIKNPLQMMKNVFYLKNDLIGKIRLIFKFMKSQPEKETTAILIKRYSQSDS